MLTLIIHRGPLAGRRIQATNFPMTIGRDPSNNLVVDDSEISRFHVRIKSRGRLVIVEDLDSRNGTYVNGDRIVNSIVRTGDKIILGSSEIVVALLAPEVQFAAEIMDFDMLVAEELGIKGPITFDGKAASTTEKKEVYERLEPSSGGYSSELWDIQGNLANLDDLKECAGRLLKGIKSLVPVLSRSAFFLWSQPSRQLIPITARQEESKLPFLLSQRGLEDAISRRQGLVVSGAAQKSGNGGRRKIVLPVLHLGDVLAVVHLEIDDPETKIPLDAIDLVQSLLQRISANVGALVLRSELDSWLLGMIETMIASVEAKDTYTRGHSERVSRYSLAIADQMRLNRETRRLLMVSSLCHDIGKIGIPDAILKKAALLSADEYNEMKLHPSIGADIISHMPNAQRFISGVKYHHEKWDGTGYPDGLEGEDIPFFGRIVAVADVFDAMVSGRAYSGFLGEEDAVQRLYDERELFDPEIVKAFVKAFESGALSLKTDTQLHDKVSPPGSRPGPKGGR